jgi:hypothetical protein
MTPTHRFLVTSTLIGSAAIAYASRAQATSRYPGEIYYHLYSSYTVPPYSPPCSLCHLRGSTGPGTAQTPFALSMKARGMVARDPTLLTNALDAMQRDEVDSDGDGAPDIREIENDTDPNTPADVSLSGEPGPNAGCGGGQKANFGGRAPAAGLGLLVSLLIARRRRRHRRVTA